MANTTFTGPVRSESTLKTISKASSGAIEHLNIFKVSNVNSTLKYLREKNFWVYGFDNKSKKDFSEIDWEGNSILVFGSEGFGLNQKTEKYIDFFVKININNKIVIQFTIQNIT